MVFSPSVSVNSLYYNILSVDIPVGAVVGGTLGGVFLLLVLVTVVVILVSL